MPILQLPVPETKDSVLRPVVNTVMKDLMKIMSLDKNTSILFIDENEEGRQFNSNLLGQSSDKLDAKTNSYGASNRVKINVTEEMDNSYVMSTQVWRTNNMAIWRDDDLKILIKPVYATTELKITIENRFTDKSKALQWRNAMRMKVSNYQDINQHVIMYHYTLPKEVIYIMREMYALRENVAGYGDTFEQYFADPKHCSPRFTHLTNDDGSWKSMPTIAEKQMRVLGWYDFDTIPEEGSKGNDSSAWTINFTYTVRFDRPLGIIFEYPLMVHNQLLDQSLRPDYDEEYGPMHAEGPQRFFSLGGILMEWFGAYDERRLQQVKWGFNVPKFDEFASADFKPGTVKLYDIMVAINANDRHDLTNLLPGDEVKIDKDILRFIVESEWPYMTRTHKSVLQLSLYNQHGLLNDSYLRFNKELDITASRNLNLRNAYHVRFGLYVDWTYLDKDAIDRLRKYPDVVDKLGEYLGKDWIINGRIPKDEMNKYVEDTSKIKYWGDRAMRTVQTQGIIAMRNEGRK